MSILEVYQNTPGWLRIVIAVLFILLLLLILIKSLFGRKKIEDVVDKRLPWLD